MRPSAPGDVEGSHLAPCTNCGALNGKTATLCWNCEVELAGSSTDATAPSLPNFKTSGEPDSATRTAETGIDQAPQQTPGAHWPMPNDAVVAALLPSEPAASVVPPDPEGPPMVEARSPPDERYDAAARQPVGSAAEPGPIDPDLQPAKAEASPEAAPEHSAPAAGQVRVVSGSLAARTETVRRKARKMVSYATVVLGAAVAVSVYFIYRQAVDDMMSLSVGGPAATNARAAAPPSQVVERSVAAIDQDPPAAVSTARGNTGERVELGANSPSKATLTAEPRVATSKRGVSKRTVESPEGAAAVARFKATPTRTGIEPPPPHPGPCTPGIAALGLCTPEPTQRRE